MHGRKSKLPIPMECNGVSQYKERIPTPEIATQCPHLSNIADEVPPLDSEARVQLLKAEMHPNP